MRDKRVLYLQYTNPAAYPNLQHSSRMLADSGWNVVFLGVGAFGGAGHIQFPEHDRITVYRMAFCAGGLLQKVHYFSYCWWAIGWALLWRPDWIYASDTLACPIARVLAGLGFHVAYHEHDSPEPASIVSMTPYMRFIHHSRRACGRNADICILPNQDRAMSLVHDTQRKGPVHVLWNCASRREAEGRTETHREGTLRLVYQGSIGPSRLPLSLIRAMATLPSAVTLTIMGYETIGSAGYVDTLLSTARGLGIFERISFLGPRSRPEMMRICATCDAGVAFVEIPGVNFNLSKLTGASNKVFDFLACGLPILVTDTPEWNRAFVEPGYGVACDPGSANSIAGAIQCLLDNPDRTRKMGESGQRRIREDWNYETQFLPVLQAMECWPNQA